MSESRTILVTGVGGGGSNNLVASLRLAGIEEAGCRLIGSNLKPEVLAKSPLAENFLLPVATDPAYPAALKALIARERVDLVMPNNDREVAAVSALRDELGCRVFLPPHEAIQTCHDKHLFHRRLSSHGLPLARSFPLESLADIPLVMKELGGGRFWVRPRSGSGSRGATWVNNAEQAEAWIKLWVEMRGYRVEQFTISEFLPGKDYCFQSVWRDGRLLVGKLCQRLAYFFGDNTLSGMTSTPAIARTLKDDAALETILAAVKAICPVPHGNFSFDLKGRADGTMCLTECNIGRFCMITPIFDRTGRYNTAEVHVRAALDMPLAIEEGLDIDEGWYLLRELDTLPTIVHESQLQRPL